MSHSVKRRMGERLKADALWLLAVASVVSYVALASLSQHFARHVAPTDRPTLTMLGLFCFAFLCYWLALILAVRLPESRKLAAGIFAAACLFRAVMLPSVPMHEIDIYRYIWDGAVVADGVSPYRYTPQQVLQAASNSSSNSSSNSLSNSASNSASNSSFDEKELRRVVALRARSASLAHSLGRIHYGEYPSPYPPVSQALFAVAAMATPDHASPAVRLGIMKGLLVCFDLATLLVVMRMVKDAGLHAGFSLAYGWCPLLMKEIANGGHLDSIAMFFTTLAIWLLLRTLRGVARPRLRAVVGTAGTLALAIGAKLYPVVLLPLFAALWWRRGGKGAAAVGIVVACAASLALLLPLFFGAAPEPGPAASEHSAPDLEMPGHAAAPLPAPPSAPRATGDPSAGLRTFLNQWEMNDLLFMVVLENLRSQDGVIPSRKPWFVFVPQDWSRALTMHWISWSARWAARLNPSRPPPSAATLPSERDLRRATFLLARIITGGLFAVIAGWLAWRAAAQNLPREWGRAALLTLAWFWLTCPTQNPWYWCWVLPLLPFARYRTWYVIAAAVMLYYLRFWLTAHAGDPPVWDTAYDGAHFFYFVIPWIEFLPCFAALGAEFLGTRAMRWRVA